VRSKSVKIARPASDGQKRIKKALLLKRRRRLSAKMRSKSVKIARPVSGGKQRAGGQGRGWPNSRAKPPRSSSVTGDSPLS